jgi:hypothetical protein
LHTARATANVTLEEPRASSLSFNTTAEVQHAEGCQPVPRRLRRDSWPVPERQASELRIAKAVGRAISEAEAAREHALELAAQAVAESRRSYPLPDAERREPPVPTTGRGLGSSLVPIGSDPFDSAR